MIIFHAQCTKNTSEIVKPLEKISKPLIVWFKDGKMKLNPVECHLYLSDSDINAINIDNFIDKSFKNGKLLGLTSDNNF